MNTVPKIIKKHRLLNFGPKRYEVAGGWGTLHKEIRNPYASPNIVKVIKSGRFRWTGHIVRMGKMRNVYKILVGRREDLDFDGR
jgi:hypothetical protein